MTVVIDEVGILFIYFLDVLFARFNDHRAGFDENILITTILRLSHFFQ